MTQSLNGIIVWESSFVCQHVASFSLSSAFVSTSCSPQCNVQSSSYALSSSRELVSASRLRLIKIPTWLPRHHNILLMMHTWPKQIAFDERSSGLMDFYGFSCTALMVLEFLSRNLCFSTWNSWPQVVLEKPFLASTHDCVRMWYKWVFETLMVLHSRSLKKSLAELQSLCRENIAALHAILLAHLRECRHKVKLLRRIN